MQIFVTLGPVFDVGNLRDRVAVLDDAGVDGVFASDHLFFAVPGGARKDSHRGNDPFVVLAAIAAMSDRLALGTMVANAGIVHPALIIRHFAQLAGLVGGDRVIAGIGAGWNTEEFDALGIDMPAHATRLDRLEEACRLTRALFDDGIATVEGDHVVARDMPMSPLFNGKPRLLLGGGSDRLLDIAGRYADHVDLNGSSRRKALGRKLPLMDDFARRQSTTVEDLVDAAARVRAVANEAGRAAPALSVVIDGLGLGKETDAALADCPYVASGDAVQIAEVIAARAARIGLSAVVVPEVAGLADVVATIRKLV